MTDLLFSCNPWRVIYLYPMTGWMGTHRLFRMTGKTVFKNRPPGYDATRHQTKQKAASGPLYRTGVNTYTDKEKPPAALCGGVLACLALYCAVPVMCPDMYTIWDTPPTPPNVSHNIKNMVKKCLKIMLTFADTNSIICT